jgi:hypothetical protein
MVVIGSLLELRLDGAAAVVCEFLSGSASLILVGQQHAVDLSAPPDLN